MWKETGYGRVGPQGLQYKASELCLLCDSLGPGQEIGRPVIVRMRFQGQWVDETEVKRPAAALLTDSLTVACSGTETGRWSTTKIVGQRGRCPRRTEPRPRPNSESCPPGALLSPWTSTNELLTCAEADEPLLLPAENNARGRSPCTQQRQPPQTRLKALDGSADMHMPVRRGTLSHGGLGITEIKIPPFRAPVPVPAESGPCWDVNVDDDRRATLKNAYYDTCMRQRQDQMRGIVSSLQRSGRPPSVGISCV